ncbi:MAG: LysM peptidoglycan-binding domain-containing protein [Nitrosomonadales bacterium]|nr:LysM peptidoglycan-binding domain-containing protein [Nitrosomonadales bacterium]
MHRFIISLICCLLPALALADVSEIQDGAPDRYTVVKGDTLWDISAKFLKSPWKWPQIWGMNKDTIQDPHWIYPGDVIVLDRTTGTLRVDRGSVASTSHTEGSGITVKLSPSVQAQNSSHNAIPVIPVEDIAPFLSRPMVIEEKELSGSSLLVGTYEQRVILGSDDIAYVKGLPEDKGLLWQIYRPGKALIDPDTKEVLGHEATYLGDARVEKFADISTLRITRAVQEINKGDRLTPVTGELTSDYVPHAPEKQVSARVISIYDGVSEAGQNAIVTINKGRRDGIENGHVLALYRKGEVLNENRKTITLPDTRYGLLFIFRTFDKVAYALVMHTQLPVELLDRAQTP